MQVIDVNPQSLGGLLVGCPTHARGWFKRTPSRGPRSSEPKPMCIVSRVCAVAALLAPQSG